MVFFLESLFKKSCKSGRLNKREWNPTNSKPAFFTDLQKVSLSDFELSTGSGHIQLGAISTPEQPWLFIKSRKNNKNLLSHAMFETEIFIF